ncbi:MAG: fasciclin domain-containing protein, partial [Anaerolineae bacterium]|nr:fasciclin domain-containing protein [Anaerolineae bacterium]
EEAAPQPAAVLTQAPTETPAPTPIPPTPTAEPSEAPAATVANTPDPDLPSIGDALWSPNSISAAENIQQFAEQLMLSRFLFAFHDDGPFTIFAPTNGFATGEGFKEVMEAHVVPGSYRQADLLAMDGQSLITSVEGRSIAVTVKDEVVYLNDLAVITKTDILARNGVIHVIDQLLLPLTD